MSSITIHDLPPELHDELQERADRNRRSLNAEIISALESVVSPGGRPSDEEILARADESRARSRELGITFTDEEITRYKNMGRL
jgi:plasmid stability protein